VKHEHDEFTHVIEAWLDAPEAEEDPGTVVDRVIAHLDATPQRRFSWPTRRLPNMNSTVRLAIACGAVVVVALVGIGLLRPTGGLGGPVASAVASAAPSSVQATPKAEPSQSALPADVVRESCCLAVDHRYSVTVTGVSLSFVVPNHGWESHQRPYISKSDEGPQGAEAVIYWAGYPDSLSAQRCDAVLRSGLGTPAQVATEIATAPGVELVSGPVGVTLDGRPAQRLAVTVQERVGCDPGFFYRWDPFGAGAMWMATGLGDTISIWIVDVDGTLIFLAVGTHPEAGQRIRGEIDEIIQSVQFR
jgi:hypothetical protein